MRKCYLLFALALFVNHGFSQGLTGTLTIGSSESADYETFTEAIAELNSNGVGEGGVTFLVESDTYVENIVLTTITGASQENRVVFEALDSENPPMIRGIGTTGFSDAIIRLSGVSFVTFDGFIIQDGSTDITEEVEFGIRIIGTTSAGNQFNEFKNIDIFLGASGSNNTVRTRGISATRVTSETSPSLGNHNNLFQNIKINNSAGGIQLRGNTASTLDTNNVIQNCTFGNSRRIGHDTNFGGSNAISLQAQKNILVENCVIDSVKLSGTPALPVVIAGLSIEISSGIITGNQINFMESNGNQETNGVSRATPMGIRVSTLTNNEVLFSNNIIRNLKRNDHIGPTGDVSFSLIGMWIFQVSADGAGLTKVINNTIYLDQEEPVPYRTAGIQLRVTTGTLYNVELFNNIIVNNTSTTGPVYRSIAIADGFTPRTFLSSNHNVLQADGINGAVGAIGFSLGGSQQIGTDIATWQTISQGDTNSVQTEVFFMDLEVGNLRIDENQVGNIMHFSVPSNPLVPTDIEGMLRTEPITGAGAFEINGLTVGITNPFAADNTFKAYPNPFNSTLTLEMDLNTSSFTNFRIIDVTGKTVYEEAAGSLPNGFYRKILNLDNLNSGIYIVQIIGTQGNPVQTMKVIKN
ncbi:MAG: T9SS type A sorting domain-containing protein [Luteibaculaceae bacterium]